MHKANLKAWFAISIILVGTAVSNDAYSSEGSIVGWGNNYDEWGDWVGQATPPVGNNFVAIAAGGEHSLALRSDGSIVGWGANWYGEATPPDGNNYIAIAAGGEHSLALKSDGSIVAWGANWHGQATPPAGNNYIAIAAGARHSLALRSDGSIVGWGWNHDGQATPPAGNNYIAIAAGGYDSLALKSDGTIVGWGDNDYGQATPPAGNNFVAIAAGWEYSLALRSDGNIVGWGMNDEGQATPPAGNDFIAIAAGDLHSLALKSDGSLFAWGNNDYGQCNNVPSGNNFIAISAGGYHSLALAFHPVPSTKVCQRSVKEGIPGAENWLDTELDVLAGQLVNITATGSVCVSPDLQFGPSGNRFIDPCAPGPYGLPQYALIGKIGDSAPFYVGSQGLHVSDTNGHLYLRVNDTHSTGAYYYVRAESRVEDPNVDAEKLKAIVNILEWIAKELVRIVGMGENYSGPSFVIMPSNITFMQQGECRDMQCIFILNSPGDIVLQDAFGNAIGKDRINELDSAFYFEGDILGDGHIRDVIVLADQDPTDIGDYGVTVIPEEGADPNEPFSLFYFDRHISQIYTVVDGAPIGVRSLLYPVSIVPEPMSGDLDNNKHVDMADFTILASRWLDTGCSPSDLCNGADLDFSTKVDFADLAIFADKWLWEKIRADFDADDDVDFGDLLVLTRHWLGSKQTLDISPLPGDGRIDFRDFAEFAKYWLKATR